MHRTLGTSTLGGPCGVWGAQTLRDINLGWSLRGLGDTGTLSWASLWGLGCTSWDSSMDSSCFLPLYPIPHLLLGPGGPWGVGEGGGGCFMDCLWGGCLCSMSVLLKSLFIIRNITPTYVQHCLVLCFGEGSWFLGGCWEFQSDTEVGLCCHPWVLVQKAKSLGWGVFGGCQKGAPKSSAAPRLCLRPPYLVNGDAVAARGSDRDVDLGVPGEAGVHRAVGTLTWGGPRWIWGVQGHGGH